MEQVYDNDLIVGLGDLLGLDPYVSGEADFSSLYRRETGKQDLYTLSHYSANWATPLSGPQSGSTIDGLLSEGQLLLDQLMEENGLGLDSSVVDLSNIDELAVKLELPQTQPTLTEPTLAELVSQLPAEDPVYTSGATSPISTLPSEPASPVFISDEMFAMSSSPVLSRTATPISDSERDEVFDDILASLMDPEPLIVKAEDYVPSGLSPYSATSECESYSSAANTSYEKPCQPIKGQKIKKSKSTPYSKLPVSRKERKKLQNKEAANRYRQKKKDELKQAVEEEEGLTKRNHELKSEVMNLEREIMCLKELLSDVFNVNSF